MNLSKQAALALILLIFVSFAQPALAQDVKSVIISKLEQRTSLEDYLSDLCASIECRVYYPEGLLDDIYIYETDNGKSFISFLDVALKQRGIAYIVYRNKNIIFLERNQLNVRDQSNIADADENGNYYNSVDIGDPLLAGKYRKAKLQGYIRNGKTGEPLPGAVIFLEKLDIGLVTDWTGYYSVEVPVGKNPVTFSYVGFEDREIQVNMISPGSLDIELFESTIAIDQVVITSNSNANVVSTEMSIIRLDAKTINNIPVLLGEPDLMKAMTLLPGIQSSGDMASGFNVRGGGSDQNLIMIDEVPIYNSNHLFGLFSILDTRIIKNLELFKGGAPARYGGRISSYMDIDLKEGNLKEIEGNTSLGLFSSKITLQGPIIKEKASFIVGGRTTYSDWILKRIPDIDIRKSQANFYDLNTKLNFTLNRKNRLSIFGYMSSDYFNLANKNVFEYANRLGSIKWNHIGNEKFTYSLNLFYSEYTTNTIEKDNAAKAISIASGIQQFGGRYRVLIEPGAKHSIETGVEGNYFIFSPGSQKPYGEESEKDFLDLDQENSTELSVYLQDVYELNNLFSISAGLRYTYYASLGPGTINLYQSDVLINNTTLSGSKDFRNNEIIASYQGFEPRLGIRFVLSKASSLKLGLSRNYQYQHILSNSTLVIPTDIWKSTDKYIKPAVGDQISLGYFKNFLGGVLETSAEIYYKQIENVLEFKSGAKLIMNENIEQDVLSADMDAYGIELLLRKNAGRLTGWVSYAYSRSFLETSGANKEDLINEGSKYPSYSDKPHDLSLVTSYKITRRLTFSSSFNYSTGKPASFPESQFPVMRNNVVNYSVRNKYRLSDYHRLDLALIWETSLKKRKNLYSNWVLSIYNVYGHNNVYSTYYKKDIPSVSNDYKKFAFYELSIIGIPIPSITYNLRF